MNRYLSSRSFSKRLIKKALILLICLVTTSNKMEARVPIPTASQLAWQQAELGVVFHYDLHVFDNKKYNQAENRITPIADYNIFNPTHLNTDQWIQSAKSAGVKFAILTVTHETGFALYQSDVNPYSLKALKWKDGKGDILRDFVNSCKKYGIQPGIYIGIRWNAFMGVYDFKVQGDNAFAKNRQAYYNRYCEQLTTELVSRYGKLFFIWFDGGAHGPEQGGPDILPIIEKYQPDAIFYHNLQRADVRWGGSESGTVPYPCWATFGYPAWFNYSGAKENFAPIKNGDPNGKYYMPAMADAPLRGYKGRHEWFWEPGDEANIFPVENLMDMYVKSVGRNSTLIMGLTPDADGLLPTPDVQRLKEWGDEIKHRFSNPIVSTSGFGEKLNLKLPQKQKVKQVVLMEDISKGERVRKFTLEGKTKSGWKTIFNGSGIGHKFIHGFDEIEVSEVRLIINESKGEPQLKSMEIY